MRDPTLNQPAAVCSVEDLAGLFAAALYSAKSECRPEERGRDR
jgi:hypothetical protein